MFRTLSFVRRKLPLFSPLSPINRVRFLTANSFVDRKDVETRIIQVVQEFTSSKSPKESKEPQKVSLTTTFNELGLDSLDGVEVLMKIEDEFSIDINDDDSEKITSVAAAVDFVSSNMKAK